MAKIVKRFRWLTLLLLVQSTLLWAATSNPPISSLDGAPLLAHPSLEYFVDSDGSTVFHPDMAKEPSSSPWQKAQSASAFENGSSDHYWFRLRLNNPANVPFEWYLHHTESIIYRLQVYQLRKTPDYALQAQPMLLSGVTQNTRIPINIPANSEVTLILRVEHQALSFITTASFQQAKTLLMQGNQKERFDWFFLGVLAVMAIFHLMLYANTRDVNYLYYAFYVSNVFVNFFALNGFPKTVLGPVWAGSELHLTFATSILLFASYSLFSINFLNLRETAPKAYRFIQIITLVFSLLFLLSLSSFKMANISLIIAMGVSIPFYITIWATSIRLWRKGVPGAKFYCISWSAFLIAGLVASTEYLLKNTYSGYYIEIGHLLQITLLAMALGARINHFRLKEQQAKAESSAKMTFMANMSHELRTPLNGVIGMADLLHRTEQTDTQREYSEIIVSSGKVLLNLINDILDLTKFTEGKLQIESHKFDADQLVAECVATFFPVMLEKNVPLLATIDPTATVNLIGDEYRLRQVIFNLLSNAMKFTETGQVTLHSHSEPTDDPLTVNFVLRVEDTGVGIEAHALGHIFDQFVQADASTTRRFGGSGLGLAITKAIIEQMDGTIEASSVPGKGSVFTIRIPLVVDEDAERQRKENLLPLRGKRLLGVGDYPDVFDLLGDNLRAWGMTIDTVQGHEAALKQLPLREYDGLVVFYVDQPWEAIAQLKDCSTPILLLHHAALEPHPLLTLDKLKTLTLPCSIKRLVNSLLGVFDEAAYREELPNPIESVPDFGTTNVLVVEDNPTNQIVIVRMLERLGITADVAHNGEEAVELAERTHYSVILMDCEMPVMDGFLASEKILAQDRQPAPVIAALTAHATDDISQRCQDAGMSRVLHKPITLDELSGFLRIL